jgi:hypothetical protein
MGPSRLSQACYREIVGRGRGVSCPFRTSIAYSIQSLRLPRFAVDLGCTVSQSPLRPTPIFDSGIPATSVVPICQ